MKRKLIIFLTAIISVISCMSFSVSAFAEEILQDDEIIGDETEVTTTTVNNITEEEFNKRSEKLQEQIDEIYRLFEENGYSIEGMTGNVEGLSDEVQGLHTSLDNLYLLIESLKKTNNNNSSAAPVASPQTTPKKEPSVVTTTVTTIHAEPNTEPNGYLVEKVEKVPEKRDFITVTTRDGHIFYIVIDYEGENKNVYFLNTVDTADLKKLLNDDSDAAYVMADTKKNEELDAKTEAVVSVKETDKGEPTKKKNSNLVLYIVGIFGVIAFVFIAKKKTSKGKKKNEDDNDDFIEEEPELFVDESSEEYDEDD